MKRHIAHILCGFSVLLCMATGAIWLRSHWHSYYLIMQVHERSPDGGHAADREERSLEISEGGVVYVWTMDRGSPFQHPQPTYREWRFHSSPVTGPSWPKGESALDPDNWFMGFAYGPTGGNYSAGDVVRIPLWLPATITAIPPLIAVFRWQRTCRRAKRGLCLTCGYDLRATPDRCPECGVRT